VYLKYREKKVDSLFTIDEFNPNDPLFIHPEIKTYTYNSKEGNFIHQTYIFKEDLLASFDTEHFINMLSSILKACNLIIK
jgi:hypothetical protein